MVDTGLGTAQRRAVLAFAAEYAKGRRLYLTTTHFHPEHAFGAQVFAGEATYLVNRAQAEDLAQKGPGYLAMFTQLGEPVARELAGTQLPTPDLVYDEGYELDLGGRTVRLRPTGRAHSRGDQVVTVPDAGVLFTGDLAEAGPVRDLPLVPAARHRRLGPALDPRDGAPGRRTAPRRGPRPRRHRRREPARRGPRLPHGAARRDLAAPRLGHGQETVAEEVRALMVERHPEWRMREWIERGVGCLCAEHAAEREHAAEG